LACERNLKAGWPPEGAGVPATDVVVTDGTVDVVGHKARLRLGDAMLERY
jgi:hypothetical protein